MKKYFLIFCSVVTLIVIAGCSKESDEDEQDAVSEAGEENVDDTTENAVTTEADRSPPEDESTATHSKASDDNDTASNKSEKTQSNTDDAQADYKENVDETTESSETAEVDSPSVEDEGNPTNSKASDDNNISSNESENTRDQENGLSEYTSAQIEYARVWHQLGVHQEIDELNVHHIPKGTPMNPKDEDSGVYPEDVIQLTGSRNIDGSITYSGNGDGTINVYDVPHRWDGDYTKVGGEFYEEIINTTELVKIEPAEGKGIKRLIELISVQS